jgi:RNA polymerase sigma-70 factor (ECF subfamily)
VREINWKGDEVMDDCKLIDLFWQRSESAITEVSKKYGCYCRTIAFNILASKEDTEECVNDTYLKVWNAIPTDRPDIFSAYLGKITRNLALNRYKQRKVQKRGGGEIDLLLSELESCVPASANVEKECESTELIKAINEFLLSIKIENRVIFVRRYWYADPIVTIAQRYDMSESKVKSILFRCRNNLKTYLEKRGVKV